MLEEGESASFEEVLVSSFDSRTDCRLVLKEDWSKSQDDSAQDLAGDTSRQLRGRNSG